MELAVHSAFTFLLLPFVMQFMEGFYFFYSLGHKTCTININNFFSVLLEVNSVYSAVSGG